MDPRAPRTWLESTGHLVTFERGDHTAIGVLRPEHARNSAGVPFPTQESGVVAATLHTLRSSIAQAQVNALVQWRHRGRLRGIGRGIVLLVPREATELDYLHVRRDVQLVVAWPPVQYYPRGATPLVQPGAGDHAQNEGERQEQDRRQREGEQGLLPERDGG